MTYGSTKIYNVFQFKGTIIDYTKPHTTLVLITMWKKKKIASDGVTYEYELYFSL